MPAASAGGDAYAIAGVGLSAMGFDLPVTYDDIDEILPLPLAREREHFVKSAPLKQSKYEFLMHFHEEIEFRFENIEMCIYL